MAGMTESDVYFTLSYHVWKTLREINTELREKKGKKVDVKIDSAFRAGLSLFTDAIPAKLVIHLNSLVEQGFAEYRERRPVSEVIKKHDLKPKREYHLTSQGIRNKSKYMPDENCGLEGSLQPAYLSQD